MKRLIAFALIAAFIVAIPASHQLLAEKKNKVAICHVNGANPVIDMGYIFYFGRIIEVAEEAVPAFVAQGDGRAFWVLSPEEKAIFEEEFGEKFPNANCWFYREPW